MEQRGGTWGRVSCVTISLERSPWPATDKELRATLKMPSRSSGRSPFLRGELSLASLPSRTTAKRI